MRLAILATVPVLALGVGPAPGGDTPCAGDHTLGRAGNPQETARYAHPSETPAYTGYQVGGGRPCRGDGPSRPEGTWGWDYQGFCIRRHVMLHWWHGRCQGGAGAYKTDGPHVCPKK